MDTIFINLENSKTSDSHRLLLNLSDKINLKISILLIINMRKYGKYKKVMQETINMKYLGQCRMKNLN